MDLDDIKRGLRAEIKKRKNEQYATFQCNVRQMCKDVLAKLEEQESLIAELKERIADCDKDFDMANSQNERLLKIVRHQKYKRCLAMAMWCCDACDKWMMRKAKAIGLGKDGVKEYHQARRKLFHSMRWQTRWLKIAEKFKDKETK